MDNKYKNNLNTGETQSSKKIVTAVVYLIGTKEEFFQYYSEERELLYRLSNDKDATIIRLANSLRTKLMLNFNVTERELTQEITNLNRMGLYKDDVEGLKNLGIDIIRINYTVNKYLADLNFLISNNISKVSKWFPEWVNWEYIKSLFVITKGQNVDVIKKESCKFQYNRSAYPFTQYINWLPKIEGNILYNDKKFLEIIYSQHKDSFTDLAKITEASTITENNIYDFIDKNTEGKIEVVIDCENADALKVVSFLQSLNESEKDGLSKISLYDDSNTTSAWNFIKKAIGNNIPVEHKVVERVKDNKSLVDMKMGTEIAISHYRDNTKAFILISSDSDYWGVISSLPTANFLVMLEQSKCSEKTKQILMEHDIPYCLIDNFGIGNLKDFKDMILKDKLLENIVSQCSFNLKEIISKAYEELRIESDNTEKDRYFERYKNNIKFFIDNSGNSKFTIS